jgi:hypothetical protein
MVFDYTQTIKEVITRISRRQCLICDTNLDKDLDKKDWSIPLCRKHRAEYLEEILEGNP